MTTVTCRCRHENCGALFEAHLQPGDRTTVCPECFKQQSPDPRVTLRTLQAEALVAVFDEMSTVDDDVDLKTARDRLRAFVRTVKDLGL